jgi:hypothetical protein
VVISAYSLNSKLINSIIKNVNRPGSRFRNMADWVITATTIHCDAIDDEVTLIVYSDGKSKCTGYKKYSKPDRETARLIKAKSKRSGKKLGCAEPECSRLIQYRDKSLAE